MKKKTTIIILGAMFALIVSGVIFSFTPIMRRTLPGRISRNILGSPSATQWVEDLVEDVRTLPEPEKLREWSQELMDSYRSGTLKTNKKPTYGNQGEVLVPEDRIPVWLPDSLRKSDFQDEPEVSIFLNEDKSPRYLMYAWYLKGLIIFGDEEAEMEIYPFCIQEAAPGIYAYSLEK